MDFRNLKIWKVKSKFVLSKKVILNQMLIHWLLLFLFLAQGWKDLLHYVVGIDVVKWLLEKFVNVKSRTGISKQYAFKTSSGSILLYWPNNFFKPSLERFFYEMCTWHRKRFFVHYCLSEYYFNQQLYQNIIAYENYTYNFVISRTQKQNRVNHTI